MAKVYKVWICIEEYDTVKDEGHDVDAPGSSVAEFKNYKRAYSYAERLTNIAENI